MKYKIYILTNKINGKIYIGQTNKQGIEFENYFGSGIQITEAINKYSKENFEKLILFECNDKKTANLMEKYFIKQYNSTNDKIGYNLTNGGYGFSGKMSESHKMKISQANKGMTPWNKGKKYKHSPEHDKKLAKHLKNIWTPEMRKRTSERMKINNPMKNPEVAKKANCFRNAKP